MRSADCESGYFPNELILEILARLPIKTLLRCRSVCRFWCRLPSEKHFVQLYFQTSSHNPTVLIQTLESTRAASDFFCVDRFGLPSELSLDFLGDRVKVRASCNGLLCCASISSRGVYYVCNPMTREFRALPRSRERPFTRCQPDYEATLVGLAFDPITCNYNVLLAGFYRPFGHHPQDTLVCLLFHSQTNAWSRHLLSHTDEFTHMNRNQVVFSGASLHWLTHRCSYVLVFDLRDEGWSKVSLPDQIAATSSESRIYLLDLEGSVSVIQILGIWMYIWVLKDRVREQWALVDRVHLNCIRGVVAGAFPVSQTSDVVFFATQKKILTYGRKTKVWKEIYAVKDTFTYPLWFSAHAFKSTLFSCH